MSILAINTLLTWGSQALTTFERHHTRSAEARSLAHKLFLAQVCGSGPGTHCPAPRDAVALVV